MAWHVLRQSYGMRTLAYPTLCIIMSLCSFASLVDRACGPSRENPNAVRGDRDVKAHLKPCSLSRDLVGWKLTYGLQLLLGRSTSVSIAKGNYCFPVQVRVLEK